VLKEVARRLEKYSRTSDICARIGGDEFVVIITELGNEKYISNIVKKLSNALKAPIKVGGESFKVGASIGISLFPKHGKQLKELLAKADEIMYEVKRHGKNDFKMLG